MVNELCMASSLNQTRNHNRRSGLFAFTTHRLATAVSLILKIGSANAVKDYLGIHSLPKIHFPSAPLGCGA